MSGHPRQGASRGWMLVIAAAVAAPAVLPSYLVPIVTEGFILAIAAMALDLLIGYTGLPYFGIAAFLGLGAYTAGLLAKHVAPSFWLGAGAAVTLAAVVAALVAVPVMRTRGVAFIMVTFAVGEMAHVLAEKWDRVTGGADGLFGVPRPVDVGIVLTPYAYYLFALAACLSVYWLLRRVLESPFGHVLVGIRENETRVRALGADPRRYKIAAFVLANVIAAFAGALLAFLNGFVSPHQVTWLMSGELIIMAIVGGVGTLVGPIYGAVLLIVLRTVLSSQWGHWPAVLGLLYIAFTLAGRGGLVGIWSARARAWTRRLRAEAAA